MKRGVASAGVLQARRLMISRTGLLGLTLGVGALAVCVATLSASCSTTPTNVPVRTFELAQKMDVVCMQVNDVNGNAIASPAPVAEDNCGPVAVGVTGSTLEYHLMALVTQLAKGELAVVDLTAGNVIDEDKSTPGIQFIPVGAIPTDVAVAPPTPSHDDTEGHPLPNGGTVLRPGMSFVASADPNKPAIYGIDNRRLLGDSTGINPTTGNALPPLTLPELFACALPQTPQALTVAVVDTAPGYVLVAVLREWQGQPAKIAIIDPTALLEGAGLDDAGPGVEAGTLTACKVIGATDFSGSLPPSWTVGAPWPDGVPYVDGGIDLSDAEPSLGPGCVGPAGPTLVDGGLLPLAVGPPSAPSPTGVTLRTDVPLLYVADGAVPMIHVIDLSDPTAPREQPPLLATSMTEPARRVVVGALALSPPTHDFRRYLYATDSENGSLMVYDVTDPANTSRTPMLRPHAELNPFTPPDRIAFSSPIATLAFVQHDWPLPSPTGGSSPVQTYTGLLCNPNPNAYDEKTATFIPGDGGIGLGGYYRADQSTVIQPGSTVTNFPTRLRGVFAFVTLSTGTIVTIDVDDWDAPCRRPDPMEPGDGGTVWGLTGVLDQPEPPATSSADLNPYHVPNSYNEAVSANAATTLEFFYPVSAPNRLRSDFLLVNDPTLGNHAPNITGGALLFDPTGAPIQTGNGAPVTSPLLLPTPLPVGFVDPNNTLDPEEPDPSMRSPVSTTPTLVPAVAGTPPAQVRLSFDDPTAHIDQDWTVTFEGALPTIFGLEMDLSSNDGYQTLVAATGPIEDAGLAPTASPSPAFCSRGIEDWSLGQDRANAVLQALKADGLPTPGAGAAGNPTLPQWTSDYIELTDNLLLDNDPYWTEPTTPSPGSSLPNNDCWDPPLADPDGWDPDTPSALANDRYNACASTFGADAEDAGTSPNQSVADEFFGRDLPILEAYNDHLVLGRFGWFPTDRTGASVSELPTNRVVVGPDPSNPPFLRFARCCFHHQAAFKVRTGGEWLTVGSVSGLLSHVQTDPTTNRCVPTCNPKDVLLNSRAPDVPWGAPPGCAPLSAPPASLDRNSPLAMRNPMFSFVNWSGCAQLVSNDHTETARDTQWKFSIRGGFSPITVSLSGGTSTAVSPQSMRFIESLGQLAVVDGQQQGLVLIDLNTLGFAHNPYY